MSLTCASCRSANVTTGLGDHVSCGNCGSHAPHHAAGEPSLHAESFPFPADLTDADADDTAGETTVEAAAEGGDE